MKGGNKLPAERKNSISNRADGENIVNRKVGDLLLDNMVS
jgi:hypothetical protein